MPVRIGFIVLVAGALGLGLLAARGGSTTRALAVLSCAPASGGGASVGSVTSVPSPQAKVNASSAFTGKLLFNTNTVCTSSTGQVKYKLTKTKTMYCNSGTPPHASKVQLYPSSTVMATWISGWTWCNAAGGSSVKYSSSGKVNMKASDPLFGVFVARDLSTTAKLALGFLDVSGKSERGVIVGPGQQVTVPAGGDPGTVAPVVLTDGDRATIADLQALVPPPSFGRPAAGGSDVLARMYSRGSIRIGFDAGRAKDPLATQFAKRYFAELARLWKLRLEFRNVSGSLAPAALASGKIDVAVTPAAPPATLDVFPFFADKVKQVWRIELVEDTDWNAALRSYVLATLNTARYASLYGAVYGNPPPYEPLRPLLFA